MAQSIATLPKEIQESILNLQLPEKSVLHMPVPEFGKEMSNKSLLLLEHAPIYKDAIRIDVIPLANEINLVVASMYVQEHDWVSTKYAHDNDVLFWHTNKPKLYEMNAQLNARLDLHFYETGNSTALMQLQNFGKVGNDCIAVDHGRRYRFMIEEYRHEIEGGIFTKEEIDEIISFMIRIERSFSASAIDKTSPHTERILRDKIFLYLRQLDEKTFKRAKAVFANNKPELRRYGSEYLRNKNRKRKSSQESSGSNSESSTEI